MFILVCIVLLLFPEEASEGARYGLKVAADAVLPSILPFAAMSSAILYSGLAAKISGFCYGIFKKLHLNFKSAAPFLMSFLGGYPTGCKMVCDMYKEGEITKDEAEKILAYTNNGGLAFALNVCGRGFFDDTKSGIIIFMAAFIASLVSGCILCRDKCGEKILAKNKKLPFGAVFGKSIISAGSVLVNVAASFIVFYALLYAFKLDKYPLLGGCMELTNGIKYAGVIKNVPLGAFFFCLGGVGVWCQSSALCADDSISLKYYIKGKLLSAPIAFLAAYVMENMRYWGKDVILFSHLAAVAIAGAIKMLRAVARSDFFKITYFRGNH